MKYSVECVSYKHYPTFREVTSKIADYDSFDEAAETARLWEYDHDLLVKNRDISEYHISLRIEVHGSD